MSWENLEEMMTELLMLDRGRTVPGSGNGKSEEDVIGLSTITQCKYSDKKNMSILKKDMVRLKDAAELQNKMPLFVTEHDGELLLTLPESPIFKDVMNYIVGMSLIRRFEIEASTFNDKPLNTATRKDMVRLMRTRSIPILEALTNKYVNLVDALEEQLLSEGAELQTTLKLED